MVRLAIFASGRGSNARQIIKYFKGNPKVVIASIIANKETAGVLDLAIENNIPSKVITRNSFYNSEETVRYLKDHEITHIILAGFLWKIPERLIKAFPGKIINIHPALLPKYGGKGMYGHFVHEAVYEHQEKKSGITIHLVNEHYDEGRILFQASCNLNPSDDPDTIASKVLELEHEYFPKVIEVWVTTYA